METNYFVDADEDFTGVMVCEKTSNTAQVSTVVSFGNCEERGFSKKEARELCETLCAVLNERSRVREEKEKTKEEMSLHNVYLYELPAKNEKGQRPLHVFINGRVIHFSVRDITSPDRFIFIDNEAPMPSLLETRLIRNADAGSLCTLFTLGQKTYNLYTMPEELYEQAAELVSNNHLALTSNYFPVCFITRHLVPSFCKKNEKTSIIKTIPLIRDHNLRSAINHALSNN